MRCSYSRAYLTNCAVPGTAKTLLVYHAGHPAPGGDFRQTAPGGDAPRYCSHAYETNCLGRRHGEVLRAYLPDTVLIVTRPPDRPRAVISFSCIPDTLPRVAINTILLSNIPDTLLLRTAILREYTRDTLPRAAIPDELHRAIHRNCSHAFQTHSLRQRYRMPLVVYSCPRAVERSYSGTQSERHGAR